MTANDNTDYILSRVVDYLNGKGVTVLLDDLKSHINDKPKHKTKKNHKFVVTPEKEIKPKELKFKVKVKVKANENENEIYNKFIKICIQHNLLYFKFNDEFEWKGPAIKIDSDTFDTKIFADMDIHILYGCGFGILRPTASENDNSIVYDTINYDECILSENESSPYNSDNEENLSEESESESGDEIYTEEWKFDPTNTIYQLDTITNNVYCNQTDSFVGKRIDDFHIDFEAKQD